jgi:hypothetical protein
MILGGSAAASALLIPLPIPHQTKHANISTSKRPRFKIRQGCSMAQRQFLHVVYVMPIVMPISRRVCFDELDQARLLRD